MLALLRVEDPNSLRTGVLNLHRVSGDTGGWTIGGVARNKHPAWPGWRLVDKGERRLAVLMPYLKAFYRVKFWDPVRANDLPPSLKIRIFLMAVVSGVGRTARLLQTAVGAKPDGIIGSKTLASVFALPVGRVIERMCLAEILFYRDLANRYASKRKFLRGWINRSTKTIDLSNTLKQ